MRRFFELFLVAILAVGLAVGYQVATAAFTTMGPPITNNFMKPYVQELRGHKMVSAVAGTAESGATTTITGMEAGDVILDVINLGADGGTVSSSNIAGVSEAIFTAASGGATYSTSTGAATAGDNLIFFFVDIDNTN